MVATQSEPVVPSSEETRRWFRADVDGIRAVAILLVVGYHAGLPGFAGGFVGVDVFFVISGYLISRNLLREAEGAGRIALAGFWARRIRRLVPALALVVIATLIAGSVVLPGFELEDLARQGGAATLYVSNMLFAVDAQDYFAADLAGSPFLHTWSLGVEEQFYVVWPLLFGAVCWAQRKRIAARAPDRRRAALIVAFGAAFAVSMAINLVLTAKGSSWAFFGLPARSWEFAVAGLLAAIPVPQVLRRLSARTVLAFGGLVVLAAAVLLIDDSTPYPGLWALLPVVGTALLIVAGETWGDEERPTIASRVLALGPMQWLGRVSYSWYLWHWPFIVLAAVYFDNDSTRVLTLAAAVSLPVAWIAYRFFETPLRFSPFMARSNARTFVVGAGITVSVLVVAGAVWVSAPHFSSTDLAALEAPPGSSLDERVSFAVSLYRSRSDTSCPNVGAIETEDGDKYCVGGDPEGTRTVMLLGDSHAGQWRRTLDEIARDNGIKLLIRQHNGCAPFPVIYRGAVGQSDADKRLVCERQQAGNGRVLAALEPDAVIVASSAAFRDRIMTESGEAANEEEQRALWRQGAAGLLDDLAELDIPVGWILDEPGLPFEAGDCILSEGSVEACVPSRDEALERSLPLLDVEREVLAERGIGSVIDLTEIICDEARCELEVDGTLVYVDSHHLTDAYAATLREPLTTLMRDLVAVS